MRYRRWPKATVALLALGASTFVVEAATVEPCGAGSARSGKILSVIGDHELRAQPTAKGERLVNEKATAALGRKTFIVIDQSTRVLQECSKDGWSRVRVTEPEWLSATHVGWVPSKVLREQQMDAGGRRVFTDADFLWDKNTAPHKKIIVEGVNKVHRENSRCKDIDPSSAYISASKGTRKDPVFYVTCGKGNGIFNAFFSKSEVQGGSVLAAVAHIDKTRAIELCEGYARSKATHPSTVRFSRIMNLQVLEHPNGRTTVMSTFEAKNSFNMKLPYSIRCLFEASGLIEAHVVEAEG